MKKEETREERTPQTVDVYIAELPSGVPLGKVTNATRREEIANTRNEDVKREKYFVWRLLEYALMHSFGLCGESLDLRKESYGGWSLEGISLSLSHSKNALAVALSREAVGVDIEHVHMPRAEGMAERVMTAEEFADYRSFRDEERTERFIELWTAKEAMFKSRKEMYFTPCEMNTVGASIHTEHLTISGERYIFSVASAHLDGLRVFSMVDFIEKN